VKNHRKKFNQKLVGFSPSETKIPTKKNLDEDAVIGSLILPSAE
jgi:hypothetical protein